MLKNLLSLLSRHRSQKRLGGLTTKDTANFIKHRFPGVIVNDTYAVPARCTRWILVRGPATGLAGGQADGGSFNDGSRRNRGTVIVQAHSMLAWAEHHATAVWSSDQVEQAAREHLPTWLLEADNSDETVTIPDSAMLAVLGPYAENFLQNRWARCWCQECQIWYQSTVNDVDRGTDHESGLNQTVYRIRCPVGHLLEETYMNDQTIRFIRARGPCCES